MDFQIGDSVTFRKSIKQNYYGFDSDLLFIPPDRHEDEISEIINTPSENVLMKNWFLGREKDGSEATLAFWNFYEYNYEGEI